MQEWDHESEMNLHGGKGLESGISERNRELERDLEKREKRERDEFLWRIALLGFLIVAVVFFFRVGWFNPSGQIIGSIIILVARAL